MATKARLSDVTLDEVSLVDNPAAHLSTVVLMKRSSDGDDVGKKTTGVQFNLGFPKEGGSEVQSVVFDAEEWDEEKAKKWLKDHNMKAGKLDQTTNTLRFRQTDPANYEKFRMITPGKGVSKALRQDQSLIRAQAAIEQELASRFHAKHPDGYMMRPWIRDMYEDTVVYDYDGSTYRVDYELDVEGGKFKVTLAEPVPVTVTYVDVAKGKKPCAGKKTEVEGKSEGKAKEPDADEADEDLVARLSQTEQKLKGMKDKLTKFNPYHDAKGRFAGKGGGAGGGGTTSTNHQARGFNQVGLGDAAFSEAERLKGIATSGKNQSAYKRAANAYEKAATHYGEAAGSWNAEARFRQNDPKMTRTDVMRARSYSDKAEAKWNAAKKEAKMLRTAALKLRYPNL